MSFRKLVAVIRSLISRHKEPSSLQKMPLDAGGRALHVEASRMDDLLVCPMDTSSESIIDKLDKDTIIYILSFLDTPSDLACVSCVCCSWRRYVIDGKLWKKMCIQVFPEIGKDYKLSNYREASSSDQRDVIKRSKCLEAESSASEILLKKLLKPPLQRTCISESLHASSTDNLPQESVAQTLYREPEYPDREVPSYWSSTGQEDTSVPEMLTYRLVSDLCVVHDVKVRPFQARFQHGHPIYSSQMVRFRFGYSRVAKPHWSGLLECFLDVPQRDEYVWTYVSPTYPMLQEDTLQTFQLPKPTLCLGGIFQIEFMGRVQTQESDGLYYVCICHVHVTGHPLLDFKFEGIDEKGELVLKHLSQREKPSALIQTFKNSSSKNNNLLHLIEQVRRNRIVPRNRSTVDMLLQQLQDAGLLKDGESDDD